MISKYDLIKYLKSAKQSGRNLCVVLSEDEKSILDSKTNEYVCSVDTFLQHLREEEHCDFESIYYDHASLTDIYRCRQCGTVIFGGDDERYNPNEKCPTCCKDPSVTWNTCWTKEDIDADLEKQKAIQSLVEEQAWMNRAVKRRKARNGLYDWQRWQKTFRTKKYSYEITCINFGYDGDVGKVDPKRNDAHLEVHVYNNKTGISKRHICIPLSFRYIYIRWIFPHTKRYKQHVLL